MIRLSNILAGLKLNFRDWKPAKNTSHWNISGMYANVEKFSERFRNWEKSRYKLAIAVWWDYFTSFTATHHPWKCAGVVIVPCYAGRGGIFWKNRPSDNLNRRTSIIFRKKKGQFCQYPFWFSFECYNETDFDSKFPGNGRQSNRTSLVIQLALHDIQDGATGKCWGQPRSQALLDFQYGGGWKPRRPRKRGLC